MKLTLLVLLFAILVLSQGCCSKTQRFELGCVDECVPDTIIVETTKTIKQIIPPLPKEPTPTNAKVYLLEINGQQFYAMTRKDTAIVSGNYESYKGYALSLRNILYNLKK